MHRVLGEKPQKYPSDNREHVAGIRSSSVVFVFCSVLEDARELDVVEIALLVNGGLPVELIHFLICEAVAHGGQQLPQVVLLDGAWRAIRDGLTDTQVHDMS